MLIVSLILGFTLNTNKKEKVYEVFIPFGSDESSGDIRLLKKRCDMSSINDIKIETVLYELDFYIKNGC